jgi:nucleotide-binding universal stress UspA family protein
MTAEQTRDPAPRDPARGHRILVCLDRTPDSEASLFPALSLARTLNSAVTLAHVLEPREPHQRAHATDVLDWEISRLEGRAYLEQIRKSAEASLGRSIDTRLEQGRPAERIVDLERELGVDLTFLGSNAGAGLAHLGGTAQQLLATMHGSLYLAHARPNASAAPPLRILVPLDGSIRTESVLPLAARIAHANRAELLLVNVVREPIANAFMRAGDGLDLARQLATELESAATRYLHRLSEQLASEVASVRTLVVRHANEPQCILDVSNSEHIDLLVLSAHGAGCDPARSFGGVASVLLMRSTVPILVLQDLPEQDAQRKNAAADVGVPLRARFSAEGA